MREQHWIDKLQPKLNSTSAFAYIHTHEFNIHHVGCNLCLPHILAMKAHRKAINHELGIVFKIKAIVYHEPKPKPKPKSKPKSKPKTECKFCGYAVQNMIHHEQTQTHKNAVNPPKPKPEPSTKEQEEKYGTPARRHRTYWEIWKKQGRLGEPPPEKYLFEFDETETYMIKDEEGNECYTKCY